jgi:hypothetical protein
VKCGEEEILGHAQALGRRTQVQPYWCHRVRPPNVHILFIYLSVKTKWLEFIQNWRKAHLQTIVCLYYKTWSRIAEKPKFIYPIEWIRDSISPE